MVNIYDSTFTHPENNKNKLQHEKIKLEVKLDVLQNIIGFSKSLEVLKSDQGHDLFLIKN
jgi:hypothetical protein